MVIEVKISIIREIVTRRSKLKESQKSNYAKKLTNEGQRHWIHPLKKKNDGK